MRACSLYLLERSISFLPIYISLYITFTFQRSDFYETLSICILTKYSLDTTRYLQISISYKDFILQKLSTKKNIEKETADDDYSDVTFFDQ